MRYGVMKPFAIFMITSVLPRFLLEGSTDLSRFALGCFSTAHRQKSLFTGPKYELPLAHRDLARTELIEGVLNEVEAEVRVIDPITIAHLFLQTCTFAKNLSALVEVVILQICYPRSFLSSCSASLPLM